MIKKQVCNSLKSNVTLLSQYYLAICACIFCSWISFTICETSMKVMFENKNLLYGLKMLCYFGLNLFINEKLIQHWAFTTSTHAKFPSSSHWQAKVITDFDKQTDDPFDMDSLGTSQWWTFILYKVCRKGITIPVHLVCQQPYCSCFCWSQWQNSFPFQDCGQWC